jgi:hypothetical protein
MQFDFQPPPHLDPKLVVRGLVRARGLRTCGSFLGVLALSAFALHLGDWVKHRNGWEAEALYFLLHTPGIFGLMAALFFGVAAYGWLRGRSAALGDAARFATDPVGFCLSHQDAIGMDARTLAFAQSYSERYEEARAKHEAARDAFLSNVNIPLKDRIMVLGPGVQLVDIKVPPPIKPAEPTQ